MFELLGVPPQALFGQLLLGLINGSFYAMLSLGRNGASGVARPTVLWRLPPRPTRPRDVPRRQVYVAVF